MDPISALEISGSGLAAQRARMNVLAENLANVETTRTAEGGPYRRKLVVFGAAEEAFGQALEAARGGVTVVGVRESDEPARRVHLPAHPDADADGYVLMPNVNPMLEMVDLLAATRAYEANVTAVQAAKSMAAKALEIGR
ncbi:MAG: flagellar basal body rod protein FlgC [Candidatus Methylomirabilales bacterium]